MGTSASTTKPATFTAPDGATITYVPPADVVSTRPPMIVGSDLNPLDRKRLPGAKFTRFYNVPGGGFKPPTIPAGTVAFISIKDDPATPAVSDALKRYFTALPTSPAVAGFPFVVMFDYNHEPEGDTSVDLYQTRTNALADICASDGRGLVGQVECFTGYEEQHLNKGIRAEDWWTGRAQVLAMDLYQEHQLPTYTPSPAFFARTLQIANNVGCQYIGIGELGRQPLATDSAGHGAGMAYSSDIAYADGLTVEDDGVICLFAGLWDQGGCALSATQLAYVNASIALI